MKSLKNVLAALAFVFAFGAAVSTSASAAFGLPVFEKDTLGNCSPIECIQGLVPDCSDATPGFSYWDTNQCNDKQVIPEQP